KAVPWITFAITLLSARGFLMLHYGVRSFALVVGSTVWGLILLMCSLLLVNGPALASIAAAAYPGLAPLSIDGITAILQATAASSIVGLSTCLLYTIRLKSNVNFALISAGVFLSSAAMLMNDAWNYNFHPGPV